MRRPPSDTVDTLLHECIHASLFLKHGVRRDGPDGHGPLFLSEAARINKLAGSNVTVYHTFVDEVEAQRTHWWRCTSCGKVVKRAMNRVPSLHDDWWPEHERICGGVFEKTHEPSPKSPVRKRPRMGAIAVNADGTGPVGGAFRGSGRENFGKTSVMQTHRIDSMFEKSGGSSQAGRALPGVSTPQGQTASSRHAGGATLSFPCPVCQEHFISEAAVNSHLDQCLIGVTSQPPSLPPDDKGEVAGAQGSKWSRFLGEDGDDVVPKCPAVEPLLEEVHVYPVADDKNGHSRGKRPFDSMNDTPKERIQLSPEARGGKTLLPISADVDEGNTRGFPAKAVSVTEKLSQLASGKFLDFALGIGKPFAPSECHSILKGSEPSGISGDEITPLPGFPFGVPTMFDAHNSRQLSNRIGLWHPNGRDDEAPFASSAARVGLTPAAFMSAVLSRCRRDGNSIVLSDDARDMFVRKRGALPNPCDRLLRGLPSFEPGAALVKKPKSADTVSLRTRRNPAVAAPVAVVTESHDNPSKPALLSSAVRPSGSMQKPSNSAKVQGRSRRIDEYFGSRSNAAIAPNRGNKQHAVPHRGVSDPCQSDPKTVIDVDADAHVETPLVGPVGQEQLPVSKPTGQERSMLDARLTSCPMCDIEVERENIDKHLAACIGDSLPSQLEDGEISAPIDLSVERDRSCPGSHGIVERSSAAASATCAICGDEVLDSEKDRHRNECMATFAEGVFS